MTLERFRGELAPLELAEALLEKEWDNFLAMERVGEKVRALESGGQDRVQDWKIGRQDFRGPEADALRVMLDNPQQFYSEVTFCRAAPRTRRAGMHWIAPLLDEPGFIESCKDYDPIKLGRLVAIQRFFRSAFVQVAG